MNKKHPLAYMFRKRKIKEEDLDNYFDLICVQNYFDGKFDNNIQVENNREAWELIKNKLIKPQE